MQRRGADHCKEEIQLNQLTIARIMKIPVLCVSLVIPMHIWAAGFPCNKANAVAEKLICSENILSKRDDELTLLYKLLLKSDRNADEIRKVQRKWLSEVRDKCADKPCLHRVYSDQIAFLLKHLVGSPNETNERISSIPLGAMRYLVVTENSVLFVNIHSGIVDDLGGGNYVEHSRSGYIGANATWHLFKSNGMSRGNMWSVYFAVLAKQDDASNAPVVQRLLELSEDGEAGLCGSDPERAKAIALSKARKLEDHRVNSTGDDSPVISFSVLEKDCVTWKEGKYSVRYIYTNGRFEKQE